MNINEEKDTRPIMVSIRCIAYNHEKYIRDALEGFVMQKTNFRFEAIVHDDASTDGTAAIIREYAEKYPDIIKPIYETENQYSKHDGSLRRIMTEACVGKYIALCEGDDYWTDPYKLQKQVDFMEKHPDCSLTYHACKNVFDDVEGYTFGETVKESYTSVSLLNDYFQTATIVVRRDVFTSELYKKAVQTGCLSGDTLLCLTASKYGKLMGVNEQMSVYRRHSSGLSQHMENGEKIYNNYKAWIAVSMLFGRDVKRWLEEHRLKMYIVKAFMLKDFLLLIKLIRYGIMKVPYSVFLATMQILNYCFNRIIRFDFVHKHSF